jgi:phage terminase large subunit GpA-like protein
LTPQLARIRATVARRLKPPPAPRPMGEFARAMLLPDGPAAGQRWEPSSEPTQAALLDALASGRYRRFVVVFPSQRGKTLGAILLPTLYAIAEQRRSVGYVMPNLDKLAQHWDGKIRPAIEGTGFGAWLPQTGPGSRGGKPAVLTMRDPRNNSVAGRIYFMATGGGGKETSVSSVSPHLIVYDEADDAENAGQIELVFRRVESYGAAGQAIIASTVNDRRGRGDHPILLMHAAGTRSRMAHRCPHCEQYSPLEQEHLNPDTGAVSCPRCGVTWSEADRRTALNRARLVHAGQIIQDGQTVGPEPEGGCFSLLANGLDFHMGNPLAIAAEYRAARAAELKGDFSLMRTHQQKVWCQPYEEPEPEGEISHRLLADMSSLSPYHRRTVPAWAHFLTMAQDVQGDRHYWLVTAHGPDDRWAIVDWGYEHLVDLGSDGKPLRAPTPADRIQVMNKIRDLAALGWQIEGTEDRMVPVSRGVDIGWNTDEVASWVQGNPTWKAVRGVGEDEAKHITGGIERTLPPALMRTKSIIIRRPPGWRIYWHKVDGGQFRRNAHAALLRSPDQPASGMVPHGLKASDALLLHLTGEVWTEPEGKPGYWREVRRRHDYLDCLVYALALALLHRHMPDARGERITAEPTAGQEAPLRPARHTPPRTVGGGYLNGF